MKRAWSIFIIGIVLAAAGFVCTYIFAASSEREMKRSSNPELAWLKQEYQLNDSQYRCVCDLYAGYHPKCVEMCREIDAQNARLNTLLASTNVVTPEIRQALTDSAMLRSKCEGNMLNYFYQVSQAMSPEQGRRYLAWMQKETLIPSPMSAKNENNSSQIKLK